MAVVLCCGVYCVCVGFGVGGSVVNGLVAQCVKVGSYIKRDDYGLVALPSGVMLDYTPSPTRDVAWLYALLETVSSYG